MTKVSTKRLIILQNKQRPGDQAWVIPPRWKSRKDAQKELPALYQRFLEDEPKPITIDEFAEWLATFCNYEVIPVDCGSCAFDLGRGPARRVRQKTG